MEPDLARSSFTTGEFSRQTMLTTKALRVYDEIGLLRPERVYPYDGVVGPRRSNIGPPVLPAETPRARPR